MRRLVLCALWSTGSCDGEMPLPDPRYVEDPTSLCDPATCECSTEPFVWDLYYWREWFEQKCPATWGQMTDVHGRCIEMGEDCEDEPPLVTDDPAFAATEEQREVCRAWYEDGINPPACNPP